MIAVDDIDFADAPGEVFGFLGPNGAGKTTTLNMLCTIHVHSVHFNRPTLDDVFVKLTGHQIRPSEADGIEAVRGMQRRWAGVAR